MSNQPADPRLDYVICDLTVKLSGDKNTVIAQIAVALAQQFHYLGPYYGRSPKPEVYGVTFPTRWVPRFPLRELMDNFTQFHFQFTDRAFAICRVTGMPVALRFGEVWTPRFEPIWFGPDDGDRYAAGDTTLAFSRFGYDTLVADRIVHIGELAADYNYGTPSTPVVLSGTSEDAAREMDAAIAVAFTDRTFTAEEKAAAIAKLRQFDGDPGMEQA